MKSKRIVFIPVIAILAGFSVFLAVLLICLDLFPAIAEEKLESRARERAAEIESAELKEVGRQLDAYSGKAKAEPPERRRHESTERGGPPLGERLQHLTEAAEHLQLAGFRAEADEWRHRAEEMRRDHAAAGGDERVEQLLHRVEELQDVMSKMRQDMQRLSEELAERRGPE